MSRCIVIAIFDIQEGVEVIKQKFPPATNDPHGNARVIEELARAGASGSMNMNILTSIESATGAAAVSTIACTRANAAGNWVEIEGIRLMEGAITIACTRANAALDRIILASVVLTEGTEFLRGSTDNECATNLAAAIDTNIHLSGFVDAVASTNTVTIRARYPGQRMIATTSDATAFAITNPTGFADFGRGATDAECAANLSEAINNHPVLDGMYSTTTATNTITLTTRLPGVFGSSLDISTDDATAFAIMQPMTRATITCTQANAAGDSVTIQGTTLTEGVDFARGATNADTAIALAAAVNANTTINDLCAANVSSNACRIFFARAGTITITTSDATAFAVTRAAPHGTRGTTVRGRRAHLFGRGQP